jgi:hypothetical protein
MLYAMREPEYRRLKKKIEDEYRDKLKALDMVYRMAAPSNSHDNGNDARQSKGVVRQAVLKSLQSISGDFSAREVENQIKIDDPTATYNRASISSTLKRMENHSIVVVLQGKGKRPTSYRKK